MNIGQYIKNFRVNKGLTRKEFSEITTISAGYIEEIENNKKKPTIEILQKISSSFNLTVSELIGETPPIVSPEFRELLDSLKDLNSEQQKMLINIIKQIKNFGNLFK